MPTTTKTPKKADRAAPTCSPSPEEWWATHAALLAEKMKVGGVKDFRVSLTDRGTYEFEVNPIHEANASVLPPDGGATPKTKTGN